MSLSTITDFLAIVGIILIGAGLFLCYPYLVLIYSGVVCLCIAWSIVRRRPTE